MDKRKRTNNDIQNITQKTKVRAARTSNIFHNGQPGHCGNRKLSN